MKNLDKFRTKLSLCRFGWYGVNSSFTWVYVVFRIVRQT